MNRQPYEPTQKERATLDAHHTRWKKKPPALHRWHGARSAIVTDTFVNRHHSLPFVGAAQHAINVSEPLGQSDFPGGTLWMCARTRICSFLAGFRTIQVYPKDLPFARGKLKMR
jgi:hypothetical protein